MTEIVHKRRLVGPGRYEALDIPVPPANNFMPILPSCRFRLAPTGELIKCPSCAKNKRTELRVYGCAVHKSCVLSAEAPVSVAVCRYCPDREPFSVSHPRVDDEARPPAPLEAPTIALNHVRTAPEALPSSTPAAPVRTRLRWAYGVTTVPSRRDTLLSRTLASLARSGFDRPWLFVDGARPDNDWDRFALLDGRPRFAGATYRYPRVQTHGHWLLSLTELHIREPAAERYAMFQDDFVTGLNLRRFLEEWYPETGYLNLFTFASNLSVAPIDPARRMPKLGWYESNQMGRGAVALVFSREAVKVLLSSRHIQEKCECPKRGTNRVDGGILESFRAAGWKEWVHNPSLVQHTGEQSSMGNLPHAPSPVFRGEEFDYMTLLK